ncbi:DUF3299 domain-containing protein [Henriciella litoralis]|uniref:DUF3299 domain-containing protein n=1 Tax=Henriciella litoralis TaxID=568102 RepID=UPI0009FFFB72|nr:DUF3299 domain-containing protein [Henriciella litoralis]
MTFEAGPDGVEVSSVDEPARASTDGSARPAYWAEGTLSSEENRNEVGNAAYTMTLNKLEPYRTIRN